MNLKKGTTIKGIVTTVENYGLFLELDNNEKGFLPKENMYIAKKKKLTELFSSGYSLEAKVLGKKKDYFTLTQKELTTAEIKSDNNEPINKKVRSKKKTTNRDSHKEKTKINNPSSKRTKEQSISPEENLKKEKKTTLADLKKLSSLGNIKISHQKKQTKELELQPEEKTEKVLLEVPENFIENITNNFEIQSTKLEQVTTTLKERGFLNGN